MIISTTKESLTKRCNGDMKKSSLVRMSGFYELITASVLPLVKYEFRSANKYKHLARK